MESNTEVVENSEAHIELDCSSDAEKKCSNGATPGTIATGTTLAEASSLSFVAPDELPLVSLENNATPQKESDHDSCYSNKGKTNCANDIRDITDSRRKFRIIGLRFPGKWINHEKLGGILAKSESFHVWFDKTEKDGSKSGGASITFETTEEAQAAFTAIHRMAVDGFKLQASKPFYDEMANANFARSLPAIPFKINVSDPDSSRRLYAIHLTSSTDQMLLSSILGSDSIEIINIGMDPFVANEKQAEITFRSADEANDAKIELADGFEIDEGDRQSVMKLLTAEEYLSHMKKESEKAHSLRATTTSSESSVMSPGSASFIPAPSISVEDVANFLQQHIDATRTNWAELNEVDELWKLCDEVSHQHKGIPDSLLKPGLLMVLEQYLRTLPSKWMRQHVEDLIKIWKREVQSTKTAHRPTAFMMSAAPYSPPNNQSPKKVITSDKKKRALTTMMCVGESLKKVRTTLAVEEGELEVDEDEHGIFTIEGEPLTFESWRKFNKEKEVVTLPLPCPIKPDFQKIRSRHRKELREKIGQEKVMKLQETSAEKYKEEPIVDSEIKETQPVEESSVLQSELQASAEELEEGEMLESSSEASSSSSHTSSSDSEDFPSRSRRRKRKAHKRDQNPRSSLFSSMEQSSRFTSLFKQLYERRQILAKGLSPSQKTNLIKIINQVTSSPHGYTSAQQNMLKLFIRNFAKQNQNLSSK